MGVHVSGWRLARAVASEGGLGVVSGTAIETVVARLLQLGDIGGDLRRAFEAFPFPRWADAFWERYFVAGGKRCDAAFLPVPMHGLKRAPFLEAMSVVAGFAAVWLAKEGHPGRVGINLLCKIPLPTLPVLFGAMLAGVDVVLMGAGIPRTIPGILDDLAVGRETALRLDVAGAPAGAVTQVTFDPAAFCEGVVPLLHRPAFFAVVSSSVLAMTLAKKANGTVDGFVVEYPEAGGHNAPPRGALALSQTGEPVYGDRDRTDPDAIRRLGLPFWLAGGFGMPGKLAEALALGASGIQAGTLFAFCEESGLAPEIKRRVLDGVQRGHLSVHTDPTLSPTGFPFKVVREPGTTSATRRRICDLGYLRHFYWKSDGSVGARCPGESEADYLRKGGDPAETNGCACICNGLMASAGLAQIRPDAAEMPIITAGDALAALPGLLNGRRSYNARTALGWLRG